MSSQMKISDFFVSRKNVFQPKRNAKDGGEDGFKLPEKTGAKKRKIETLVDIRDAFGSSPSTATIESRNSVEDHTEVTPKRKDTPSLLAFQECKRRRKDDSNTSLTVNCKQILNAKKSARKRIFEDDSDELKQKTNTGNIFQNSPSKELLNLEKSPKHKMSVNEVKEQLAKCSNLTQLRSRLAKINDCASKLKEFQEKTKSPVKTLIKDGENNAEEKTVVITSPKKYLSSKALNVSKHAFERYAHLAAKEQDCGLTLPFKFRIFLEMFRCIDTVVSLINNREEICFLDKVKVSVEEMMRKTFDHKRLTQILAVYPEAYNIVYENTITARSESGVKLIILPPKGVKLTPSRLLQRKETFRNKLLAIVKRHHQEFLSSLNPPLVIEDNMLQRWHPNFKLDDIPDIEPRESCLPKAPSTPSTTKSFAQYLPQEEVATPEQLPVTGKIESGVLKGVNANLLAKIRAKEALSIARAMVRRPEDEKKISMIARLPELIRIIHNYFLCDGRSAIPVDELVQKCVDSYHTFISIGEVHNHIELLSDLLPDSIYVLKVRQGSYVKIDKNMGINDLLKRLQDMSCKMRNS